MSRVTMVLMLIAGMILLGAGVSGFVSDAEVSATHLGSDFDDSRYQRFDDYSIERVQQRSRRQEIGMEAVAGAGLMIVGMVFFTPRRKPAVKPVLQGAIAESVAPMPASGGEGRPVPRAGSVQDQYTSRRRRPNTSQHLRP